MEAIVAHGFMLTHKIHICSQFKSVILIMNEPGRIFFPMFHLNTVNKNETLIIISIACQRNGYRNYYIIKGKHFPNTSTAWYNMLCVAFKLTMVEIAKADFVTRDISSSS